MGVGTPIDLLEAVDRGVDMFDCSLPSALAKQGVAFTSSGRLSLYRSVYKFAEEAVDPQCPCPTCAGYSRAYLHHLAKTREPLGWQLLTRHNLRFYHDLMATMRRQILADSFAAYRDAQRPLLARGDDAHPPVAPRPRRRRHDLGALDRFAVQVSPHGYASILDRPSGEIMHAGLDPATEARALYVEQAGLAGRLRAATATPLVVWDVGLGAAHNAMAVVQCVESLTTEVGRPLRLVSFERDVAALRLALRHPAQFPYLQCAAPNHLLRFGAWRSDVASLEWTLLEGDCLTRLAEAPAPDCIFYDPFSVETDVALWTLEAFERVFAACADRDTELLTYSASTAVRAAMIAAGFVVAGGVATGSHHETTLAMTPAAALQAAARQRRVLDAAWLERWRGSDVRFPSDVPVAGQRAFSARIEAAPQFRTRA